MYSTFGFRDIIKNIYLVSKPHVNESIIGTTDDLRSPYLDFIASHQPHQVINRLNDPFDIDYESSMALKSAFGHSKYNDLNQDNLLGAMISTQKRAELTELVREGYHVLASSNPDVKALFDLVIHSIFFAHSKDNHRGRKSFGGSSSAAIGSIWISGHGDLNKYDVAEFLLHELTHHLLFIAERRERQFNYSEMLKPENFAMSAILNYSRPLDKVVHSIVVSTEIIVARKTFIGRHSVTIHPSTEIMTTQTQSSIASVLALPNLNTVLYPWTIEAIDRCQRLLESAPQSA